jgi:archaellum component FlaF (FlaF/FlaG flagellin family)
MGLSISAAFVVILIGVTLAAIVLADAFTGSYQELEDSSDERADRQRRLLDTGIDIEAALYSTSQGNGTVNVTNTGSTTLDPAGLDVLADGILLTENITSIRIDNSTAVAWFPGKTAVITIHLGGQPSRLKVVTDNGVADYTTDIILVP